MDGMITKVKLRFFLLLYKTCQTSTVVTPEILWVEQQDTIACYLFLPIFALDGLGMLVVLLWVQHTHNHPLGRLLLHYMEQYGRRAFPPFHQSSLLFLLITEYRPISSAHSHTIV